MLHTIHHHCSRCNHQDRQDYIPLDHQLHWGMRDRILNHLAMHWFLFRFLEFGKSVLTAAVVGRLVELDQYY